LLTFLEVELDTSVSEARLPKTDLINVFGSYLKIGQQIPQGEIPPIYIIGTINFACRVVFPERNPVDLTPYRDQKAQSSYFFLQQPAYDCSYTLMPLHPWVTGDLWVSPILRGMTNPVEGLKYHYFTFLPEFSPGGNMS
jgi:hypothetical protein